jgi:hypothetical protein
MVEGLLMPALEDLLDSLMAWKQPPDSDNPFSLACRVEPGADGDEIAAVLASSTCAHEPVAFWAACREAWLFEDTEFGQWGLHLLGPSESAVRTAGERAARPAELRPDDVVLGEFLGDSDLLVYAPSEQGSRRYLIALPLDPRDDWYAAGATIVEVLGRLLESGGDKYWEHGSGRDA